ncbi:hypothetical protein J8J27_27720, partial [Mycobacterium tuberculosis]|nr:hypothetical protein [Mycobacterium tuberculosis]
SVERGVPASTTARRTLAPALDDLSKAAVAYISDIADRVGPLPPAPPRGAGEVYGVLRRCNEQVGFNRQTPKEAAASFYDEAINILDRG